MIRKIQTPACDACTQGVMDAQNSHLRGTCACICHEVHGAAERWIDQRERLCTMLAAMTLEEMKEITGEIAGLPSYVIGGMEIYATHEEIPSLFGKRTRIVWTYGYVKTTYSCHRDIQDDQDFIEIGRSPFLSDAILAAACEAIKMNENDRAACEAEALAYDDDPAEDVR